MQFYYINTPWLQIQIPLLEMIMLIFIVTNENCILLYFSTHKNILYIKSLYIKSAKKALTKWNVTVFTLCGILCAASNFARFVEIGTESCGSTRLAPTSSEAMPSGVSLPVMNSKRMSFSSLRLFLQGFFYRITKCYSIFCSTLSGTTGSCRIILGIFEVGED